MTEGPEVEYDVDRILIHGAYSRPFRGMNDIALIKWKKPVVMNKSVQRVCLPGPFEEVPDGTECFITGRLFVLIVLLFSTVLT